MAALNRLAEALTPSPLIDVPTVQEKFAAEFSCWRQLAEHRGPAVEALDPWSRRHLDRLVRLESYWTAAAAGETLLHCDIRADNLLLSGERVWLVDWPSACRGAAWVDLVLFAPSVTMQGGPPPEELLARHPAARHADPEAIASVACALTGYLISRSMQPPPAGLPTVRRFQAAQGRVAQAWLARQTGWS